MNIAIFHNALDTIGGAEIVTLTLARELSACIYTTNIDLEKIIQMGFADVLPRIISIGKIPKKAPFRQQLALWRFKKLNLKNKHSFYIISGDWAISGAYHNKPNLWYVHSPLNELWQFKNFIRDTVVPLWQRPIFDLWVHINRRLTRKYAEKVDIFLANSTNTKNRIEKYYKKSATVVHPPVEVSNYTWTPDRNYWLSVNRLTAHKRVDIQMEAFAKLPDEQLIIVGSYEKGVSQFEKYKKKIEKIMPSNVKIYSWVSDKDLKKLYSECKGFITTARDEDFGLTVIEAQASGKPVIAPNEGGFKETIIEGVTGRLIPDVDSNKVVDAMGSI
ncbi:MAG: glycosyltransferase, partial [bacterium]|nr:glycosyltransferase [bacterium]